MKKGFIAAPDYREIIADAGEKKLDPADVKPLQFENNGIGPNFA